MLSDGNELGGEMIDYIVGLMGMWLFCDSIISIKLYWRESWVSCHSIRIVRGIIGIALMVIGSLGVTN